MFYKKITFFVLCLSSLASYDKVLALEQAEAAIAKYHFPEISLSAIRELLRRHITHEDVLKLIIGYLPTFYEDSILLYNCAWHSTPDTLDLLSNHSSLSPAQFFSVSESSEPDFTYQYGYCCLDDPSEVLLWRITQQALWIESSLTGAFAYGLPSSFKAEGGVLHAIMPIIKSPLLFLVSKKARYDEASEQLVVHTYLYLFDKDKKGDGDTPFIAETSIQGIEEVWPVTDGYEHTLGRCDPRGVALSNGEGTSFMLGGGSSMLIERIDKRLVRSVVRECPVAGGIQFASILARALDSDFSNSRDGRGVRWLLNRASFAQRRALTAPDKITILNDDGTQIHYLCVDTSSQSYYLPVQRIPRSGSVPPYAALSTTFPIFTHNKFPHVRSSLVGISPLGNTVCFKLHQGLQQDVWVVYTASSTDICYNRMFATMFSDLATGAPVPLHRERWRIPVDVACTIEPTKKRSNSIAPPIAPNATPFSGDYPVSHELPVCDSHFWVQREKKMRSFPAYPPGAVKRLPAYFCYATCAAACVRILGNVARSWQQAKQ